MQGFVPECLPIPTTRKFCQNTGKYHYPITTRRLRTVWVIPIPDTHYLRTYYGYTHARNFCKMSYKRVHFSTFQALFQAYPYPLPENFAEIRVKVTTHYLPKMMRMI